MQGGERKVYLFLWWVVSTRYHVGRGGATDLPPVLRLVQHLYYRARVTAASEPKVCAICTLL